MSIMRSDINTLKQMLHFETRAGLLLGIRLWCLRWIRSSFQCGGGQMFGLLGDKVGAVNGCWTRRGEWPRFFNSWHRYCLGMALLLDNFLVEVTNHFGRKDVKFKKSVCPLLRLWVGLMFWWVLMVISLSKFLPFWILKSKTVSLSANKLYVK